MKINIAANLDVNLYELVSSVSEWDEHHSDGYTRLINAKGPLDKEEKKLLKLFTKIRATFGWEGEKDIVYWAYNGFPNNNKYKKLKKIIFHFKEKKLTSGESIYEYLESKQYILKDAIEYILKEYEKIKGDKILQKLKELNVKNDIKEVDCFIVWNPDEHTRGGANGIILFEFNGNTDYFVWAGIILHESIHLVIGITFRLLKDPKYGEKFKEKSIFGGRMHASIFDELLAAGTINALVEPTDVEKKLERYKNREEGYPKELFFVWSHILDFQETISDFIKGKIDAEKTYETLVKKYIGYIK